MKRFYLGVAVLTGLFFAFVNAVQAKDEKQTSEKTIVEIAAGNKDFSKLVAAVKAAALVEALSGEGPFTVFAPTDKAFEALGEETLKAVLADKKKLTGILTYHVIKGKVKAADALALAKEEKSAKTLNGAEIKLSIKDGSLYLNGDTKVIKTDIVGKNGVIHVIDKVLLPPAPSEALHHAARMIEQSIGRGVALYNAGYHQSCAAVYHEAAVSLLKMDNVLTEESKKKLLVVVESVNGSHCYTTNAWALRHALNDIYQQMPPLQMNR